MRSSRDCSSSRSPTMRNTTFLPLSTKEGVPPARATTAIVFGLASNSRTARSSTSLAFTCVEARAAEPSHRRMSGGVGGARRRSRSGE